MNSTNVTDSSLHQVLIGITLTILVVVTVCGNVMVCLVVCFNRRLRSLTNCFIVSLAFTDLLLGLLVMPFSATYEISSHTWSMGITWCNIYISLDVMLCTASILNLFVISLDRYYAITAPLRYHSVVTPFRAGVALVLIWVVSLMVSFLPIHLGWNTNNTTIQNTHVMDRKQECMLEVNALYVLVDGLLTFYLPLVVMCITYYRIFKIAREQAQRINYTSCCTSTRNALPTLKEHKATVTLAAVMGAFIICWFPYFTVFMYRGIQGAVCETLMTIVLWLGYANSALNPILYAALNRDFRTAYQRLLRCRKVVPDARKIPLNQEMRDKTSNQTQCKLEDNSLQLHTMDEKGNSLVQDSLERNLNPARDKTSSAIVSCCQCFWLAKILPKKVVWIPVFEEPGANGQNTRQSSAQQRVIYCVVS
uniref:Histamine H2 receptor n=1 Tax=Anolis carolinensis TaxID=28377 RepID=H9GIP4_ANOCA|nr:PREDICTED: histamine H2 receptor isoform X1 [Anolis carolinensis]XP_016852850.1 PREDICTED: histamine H2 receptor isoform X1 [Anolis carolinensis]XP_016852851.1 PREDICTED: histamine H2 receptor isoform X1 [Anolis carolinensis]XP_016852852.1 PREDICTED: histamine H2 receptor isoform X1 [Anolis carolinensis]XP_016852853.1 PREDICTED: histamine H2 receptor isoform X1 [Anolis carolinensis]XP_016852854.1 PREDICTED: histamine H2 receptor isoform X1 [Anolis carolinensis]|eukprot:XP_016852849.1 PREDICTED: histamine H2 receptor isoform X1 [Anolis carolinensis]